MTNDPLRFALATCNESGETIEIDEAFTNSESDAKAALWAGGYVQVAQNLWEGEKGSFACVVDTW